MNPVLPSRGERTKAAIFAAAEALFLAHGFEGVSMDAIAERAGITKQTVYSHVGNKEALFLDLVDRMTGGAGDALSVAAPQPDIGTPPEIFLTRFAEEQLHIVVTPRLMKLRRMVIGEMNRFPELGAMLHRRGPARSVGRLSAALDLYGRAGALHHGDAVKAAEFFNWLVMGAYVNDAMLLGDAAIPSTAENTAHAQECVRIFMAAFGPRARGHTLPASATP